MFISATVSSIFSKKFVGTIGNKVRLGKIRDRKEYKQKSTAYKSRSAMEFQYNPFSKRVLLEFLREKT